MSTDDIKFINSKLDSFEKRLENKLGMLTDAIQGLSEQVGRLQTDTDNLTEGNHRHGIRGIREEIEIVRNNDIKPLSVRIAEIEADVLKYKIKAAGYGTSGGVGIYAIIELIKLVQ